MRTRGRVHARALCMRPCPFAPPCRGVGVPVAAATCVDGKLQRPGARVLTAIMYLPPTMNGGR